MAAISIRNLEEHVKERLRVRAATNGRSMEAEIRAILADAVSEPRPSEGLLPAILDRFGLIGGVDLRLPRRSTPARGPDLSS